MPNISAIEYQKRNKDRINLFVDGQYFMSMYVQMVYKYSLKIGDEIDKDKMGQIIKADNLEKAKNIALNFISRSEKSESKIREKLEDKFDDEIIQEVLEFLKKYSFLDDKRFAKRIMNNSLNFKRVGKNRIKQDLYNKGIKSSDIENIIDQVDYSQELDNAIYLAEKKYNKIKETDKFKVRNKIYQYLAYRGFSYEIINKAVRHIENQNNIL
ncbi:recombination regulator RecX [Peptostreptococcus equinus]|uniref:Regulatory protein RecX n=1 Tax=Peptostreptococcus equinus TaxID=3003601 RepID=A0ABY7JLP7_9FIRM|nr:recombination regulator RecX [Peptostreptococcus sp. CBA3647]WAW14278.1 recombination regulator RecX [Peptostreptococcus sp. CBA3647]